MDKNISTYYQGNLGFSDGGENELKISLCDTFVGFACALRLAFISIMKVDHYRTIRSLEAVF
jgi:hypothetical protein